MSLTIHIYNSHSESNEGYDVSELAHNIEHTTSLMGQPGKLTFVLEKDSDPNSEFQISVGDLIKFWHTDSETETETPIFMGNIFTIGTDITDAYRVVAYDQMRYLQNHDNLLISDMTLEDVFNKICTACEFPNKITCDLDNSIKIKKKFFEDASYFDILQYAIDYTNSYCTTKKSDTSSLKVGDEVIYSGGKSYESPTASNPATLNRTSGKAKITVISNNGKHKYHIQGITSNVYGWVDSSTISVESESDNDFDYKFYYIKDNFGTLELHELKNDYKKQANPLIIGDESLLTGYNYEVDIDRNTFNEFYFLYSPKNKDSNNTNTNEQVKEKTLIGAIQAGTKISKTNTNLDDTSVGEDTISKWGKLRKMVTVKDISDKNLLAEYMKMNVEIFNKPSRSIRISALGYDGITAGTGFNFRLNKLNIDYPVYVLSATHHYNATHHTMDLSINTNLSMEVFC